MTAYTSPAIARRQLRLALRRARETAGLTQATVAEALDWSISKVNRIETGDVKVSSTDLRALLALFDITDRAAIDEFAARARASRQRGWWDAPEFRPFLTVGMRQIIEFEGAASAVHTYHPTLVPGLFQTAEYARAVMSAYAYVMPADMSAARIESRQRRRAGLFEQVERPEYRLVLDESVALRPVGGHAVMADQLGELLSYVDTGKIDVRILPLAPGAAFGAVGAFTIFDLRDGEDAVLYQEVGAIDGCDYDRDRIQEHRVHFERMWEQSLAAQASARLLRASAATMLASLDR